MAKKIRGDSKNFGEGWAAKHFGSEGKNVFSGQQATKLLKSWGGKSLLEVKGERIAKNNQHSVVTFMHGHQLPLCNSYTYFYLSNMIKFYVFMCYCISISFHVNHNLISDLLH